MKVFIPFGVEVQYERRIAGVVVGRQRIREADGYRLKRINEAEGDVARFNLLLTEYTKAPEVTRRRIYLETLQEVLPGIRSKIIIDEATRSVLPFLNLDSQTAVRP